MVLRILKKYIKLKKDCMKDGRRGERKEMKSGGKEMVKGREREERKRNGKT